MLLFYIMWDVCWFVPFQACLYVLIRFTCQLNLCEAWLYMLWVIMELQHGYGTRIGFDMVLKLDIIVITFAFMMMGENLEGRRFVWWILLPRGMPPLGAQWMVVVLVRALSSMSSFARDCIEVMGHVTTPYICSLRRGAIVHAWALYLWQGISQVWWAWDNLVNWICFCLDCVLAYGSCQRNKGGGDIREACMIHSFMSKLYLSKCMSNVILLYLEATNYLVEYNYL